MAKAIRFFLLFTIMIPLNVPAQTWYWIGFSDKVNSVYSLGNPSQFLSERSIQRRINQNIPIDELDLPVNRDYINQVLNTGATFIHLSKWLNGITVKADSLNFAEEVSKLPFVSQVVVTKQFHLANKSRRSKFTEPVLNDVLTPIDTLKYGGSVYQVGQLNGQYLHNKNFRGKGKQIAVLDGGFYKADEYPAFDSLWANGQILGVRDFVNPLSDIFTEHYHGMSVLSIMGGNIPGQLIGTAPEASYWLFRTEEVSTEYLIEEYIWAVAAEFADSAGVDIINTSLGYTTFDDTSMNHTYADLNGNTTPVTKAANIAVSRGMLVFASAGNDGLSLWKYIGAPSDGDKVIAVGAVNKDSVTAPFTSFGPASDGDIKPNVAGVGWNTVIERSDGVVANGSGTSYSSPVLAGMAACLWQANPEATALQVKETIEKSGHLYLHPDSLLGYGIPDFEKADLILKSLKNGINILNTNHSVFPNPFNNRVVFIQNKNSEGDLLFEFIDISGRTLKQKAVKSQQIIILDELSNLPDGLILLKVKSGNSISTFKLIKLKK